MVICLYLRHFQHNIIYSLPHKQEFSTHLSNTDILLIYETRLLGAFGARAVGAGDSVSQATPVGHQVPPWDAHTVHLPAGHPDVSAVLVYASLHAVCPTTVSLAHRNQPVPSPRVTNHYQWHKYKSFKLKGPSL